MGRILIAYSARIFTMSVFLCCSVAGYAMPTVPAGYAVDEYLYLGDRALAKGLAIAPDGSLYIADSRGRILRSTAAGNFSVVNDSIPYPVGIAVTSSGRVFVGSDPYNWPNATPPPPNACYEIVGGVAQESRCGESAAIAAKGDEIYFVCGRSICRISTADFDAGEPASDVLAEHNPSGFLGIEGISFDSAEAMYFISRDQARGEAAVYAYDFRGPATHVASLTFDAGWMRYSYLFTGPGFDGRLFFTDPYPGPGYLYSMQVPGSPEVFAEDFARPTGNLFPFFGPQGIAFDGRNTLFVADVSFIWRISRLPPSVSLSASPDRATVGQTVTLTWSSANALSCTASGGTPSDGWAGPQPTIGHVALTTAAVGTYTYVLVCSSAAEDAQAQVSVTVSRPPKRSNGGGAVGPLVLALMVVGAARRCNVRRSQLRPT